jgi:hypothetical protein
MGSESNSTGWKTALLLVPALVLIDAALTFENVWPTPAVRWTGELSVELAVAVLAMALVSHWFGEIGHRALRWLAIAGVVLVVGHYADVTCQALFGRPINLYWDSRHLTNVGAMFAFVAHPWLILLVAIAAILIPVLTYLPLRWALGRIALAMRDVRWRLALGSVAAALIVLFVVLPPPEDYTTRPLQFARPVSATYGRQVRLFVDGVTGVAARSLPPQPSMRSDLARVQGADVLLIFVESYGATTWDRPSAVRALAPDRSQFEADIHETGRFVVSGFVQSPTFGGGSWLALISFLTGLEIKEEESNMRLMTQQRETILTTFKAKGYKTIAVMPGMSQPWPEGAFYGFTDIYDYFRLDYKGPSFGWWDVPDQYSLYKLDSLAIAPQPHQPVFAFFPTVSTHAPFIPTPPYQPDWSRLSSNKPFDDRALEASWDQTPDWLNLEPGYLQSVGYAFASFGGYLRHRPDRDLVMILIGDHQPPALVTGPGATWDVPVHVVASRPEILERLKQHGFRDGLTPQHPSLMKMPELTRVMLDAFGS